MFYLFWAAQDFGLEHAPEVKAVYESFEAAKAQADHDITVGRHPLRIVEMATGDVWWRMD